MIKRFFQTQDHTEVLQRAFEAIAQGRLDYTNLKEISALLLETEDYENALCLYNAWVSNTASVMLDIAFADVGDIMLLAGDAARARGAYESSLQLNPSSARVRDVLATLTLQAATGGSGPNDAETIDMLFLANTIVGCHLGSKGDYIGSQRHLVIAYNLKPDNITAVNNLFSAEIVLGHYLDSRGGHAEALLSFERAHSIKPDDPSVINNVSVTNAFIGCKLAIAGNYVEALTHFERAHSLMPNNQGVIHNLFEAHANIGCQLAIAGNYIEALTHFARANVLMPNNSGIENTLADTHAIVGYQIASTGNYVEAIAHFERAHHLMPNSSGIIHNLNAMLTNLGCKLASDGNHIEALILFERAYILMPDSHGVIHNLITVLTNIGCKLASSGNYIEALTHLERAFALMPNNPGVTRNLADSHTIIGCQLASKGNYIEALTHFERAHVLIPDDMSISHNVLTIHINVGWQLAREGDFAGAQRHAALATLVDPASKLHQGLLACSLIFSGEYNKAIPLVLSYAKDDPQLKTFFGAITLSGRRPSLTAKKEQKIRDKIDRAFSQQGQSGLLPYLTSRNIDSINEIDRLGRGYLKGRKVAVILMEYLNTNSLNMKAPLPTMICDALSDAGCDYAFFPADDISFPEYYGSEIRRKNGPKELQTLREKIYEYRPDYIYLDTKYVGEQFSLNSHFFSEIKKNLPVKIIGLVEDSISDVDLGLEHWNPVVDIFQTFEPNHVISDAYAKEAGLTYYKVMPPERAKKYGHKTYPIFCPPSKAFDRMPVPRDIESSFVGSLHGTRPYWAPLIHEFFPLSRIFSFNRSGGSLSTDEYASVLSRSMIAFNFTHRYGPIFSVTARTFEATQSGALLMEHTGDIGSYFFTPFVHFVPFRNADEMAILYDFFTNNRAYMDRIATEGRAFQGRHHDRRYFFPLIIRAIEHIERHGTI